MNASTLPAACRIRSVRGQPCVVGRAGQPDHGGPGAPGQLDGDRADPSGCPGHDHRVTLGQLHGPDRRPRGGAGHEQRSGDLPGHAGGLRRQVLLLDDDVLGVAGPVVGEPDDLVPHGESRHARAGPGDDPGQVAAFPRRERGRPPGVQHAVSDPGLAGVDPGRLDANQYLLRSRYRVRNIDDLEDLDPAVLVEPHCLHRMTSVTTRSPSPAAVSRAVGINHRPPRVMPAAPA
jgi:hypothetical protein